MKTELTEEEMQVFRQKVMDTLTPLFYEAVVRMVEREMTEEREAG